MKTNTREGEREQRLVREKENKGKRREKMIEREMKDERERNQKARKAEWCMVQDSPDMLIYTEYKK